MTENNLPSDAIKSDEENLLNNNSSQNKELEDLRLVCEREANKRKESLFNFSCLIIVMLFIVSVFIIYNIIDAVAEKGSSPWLITLGGLSFITPSVLFAYLLRHVYGCTNKEKLFSEFLSDTPVGSIVSSIKELIEVCRGGNK